MEWWRFYLVRYLLGNIVGSVLVFIYLQNKSLIPLDLTQTQTLFILVVLGFAYCYIASVPILLFHAGRNISFHKVNITLIIMSFVAIGGLSLLIAIVDSIICKKSFDILAVILFIYALLVNYSCILLVFFNKDSYYHFIKQLTKKREKKSKDHKNSNNSICSSYRHLREHGNAFFIVLFEIILFPVLCAIDNFYYLLILLALWILPSAAIWSFASLIEIKFSEFKAKN